MNDKNLTGVLLTNLGTPSAPTPSAVRRYLNEFLSDERIIELPRWLWQPLLKGVVLPLRSRYSARLYQTIWTEQGSPLLHYARLQANGLENLLQQQCDTPIKVILGMRYGEPSIASALEQLQAAGATKIILFPLYPQYSAATVGSTFDSVFRTLRSWRFIPALHMINQYSSHPAYIDALVNRMQEYWHENPAGEQLLFSFHGIPKRSLTQGDPYYYQCHLTATLVAEKLGLPKDRWQVVFQSRFGRQEWLSPYCDVTLKKLALSGVKAVDVICPGFSADCLETLEEMAERNKALFIAAGGTRFNYISALNDRHEHLQALAEIVKPLI